MNIFFKILKFIHELIRSEDLTSYEVDKILKSKGIDYMDDSAENKKTTIYNNLKMTKEQILESDKRNPGICAIVEGENIYYRDIDCLDAMEEYAKQTAISFKNWCNENQMNVDFQEQHTHSTEELASIYMEHQNKKP